MKTEKDYLRLIKGLELDKIKIIACDYHKLEG